MTYKVQKTEAEWRAELTADEYEVLRNKGTERAFTGEYWNEQADGIYQCRACGEPLFDSDSKFESHCGWPSYTKPMTDEKIDEHLDLSYGMRRTEVTCSNCGSHLGHVFEDGPPPSGLRYCINSLSVRLTGRDD